MPVDLRQLIRRHYFTLDAIATEKLPVTVKAGQKCSMIMNKGDSHMWTTDNDKIINKIPLCFVLLPLTHLRYIKLWK